MALSCQQFVWSLTNGTVASRRRLLWHARVSVMTWPCLLRSPGDDLVTRLHLSAIESLRAELHALDWKVCGTSLRACVGERHDGRARW
jgi:hypothetical protein